MYELNSHTHINIPPPPDNDLLKNDWIKELATLAKITNILASPRDDIVVGMLALRTMRWSVSNCELSLVSFFS